MEKLKDLLHDFTDVILAIGIVVAMFTVVSLNLGDWFDYDDAIAFADSTNLINMAANNEESKEDTEDNTVVAEDPSESTEETSSENTEKNTEDTTEKTSTETAKDKPATEEKHPEKKVEEKPLVVTVVEIKAITIPDGTPGVNIAKILKDQGLISDSGEFIKVAEDLKLATKLKSGTFDIPTNASVEEMVRIIARAK